MYTHKQLPCDQVPFTVEEAFKICKGYFFEKKSNESSDEPLTSGH